MLPYYIEPVLIYYFISTFSTFNTQCFIIHTIYCDFDTRNLLNYPYLLRRPGTLKIIEPGCLNHSALFFLKKLNQQNKNSIEIVGRKNSLGFHLDRVHASGAFYVAKSWAFLPQRDLGYTPFVLVDCWAEPIIGFNYFAA